MRHAALCRKRLASFWFASAARKMKTDLRSRTRARVLVARLTRFAVLVEWTPAFHTDQNFPAANLRTQLGHNSGTFAPSRMTPLNRPWCITNLTQE